MTHPLQQSTKFKRIRSLNRRLATLDRQRKAIERELDRLHHHAGIRPRDKPQFLSSASAKKWTTPDDLSPSLFTESY